MTTTIETGSGNVFADLGLPDAEELHAKARLILEIKRIIKARGLTQTEAANILGINQSDVSNLIHGKLRSITLDRLTTLMNRLGQDVEITFHEKRGKEAHTIAYATPSALAAAPKKNDGVSFD